MGSIDAGDECESSSEQPFHLARFAALIFKAPSASRPIDINMTAAAGRLGRLLGGMTVGSFNAQVSAKAAAGDNRSEHRRRVKYKLPFRALFLKMKDEQKNRGVLTK